MSEVKCEESQLLQDLSMLVRRMVIRLRLIDDAKGNELADKATDFLRRKGLAGGHADLLRAAEPTPAIEVSGGWIACRERLPDTDSVLGWVSGYGTLRVIFRRFLEGGFGVERPPHIRRP